MGDIFEMSNRTMWRLLGYYFGDEDRIDTRLSSELTLIPQPA